MIRVHHLENSRSQRILWLLEELGLPYEVVRYQRAKSLAAPPELKRVHPLGKSPVIEDGGTVVAETGAIVEYLVDRAGGMFGIPRDRDGALRYRFFLHYAEGSVMTALMMGFVGGLVPIVGRLMMRRLQPMIDVHLDYVEAELTARSWLAGGEIGAADVMMSFPIEFAAKRFHGLAGRPRLAEWLARIHARPAYQRALAAGGPYDFA